MRNNPIEEMTTQVGSIVPDTTPPELLSFSFQYTADGKAPVALSLNFTEPISPTTIDLDKIVLQNSTDSSATTLTLTTSVYPDIYSSVVAITVSNVDLARIAEVNGLGTNTDSTYIKLEDAAVHDAFEVPIQATIPLQVAPPLVDMVPPSLLQATIDLDTGNVTLVFSQPVDTNTFDASQLTVQSSRTSSAKSYTFLEGIALPTDNTNVVYLFASEDDINGILSVEGLATNASTAYVSAGEGLIQDENGHKSFEVLSTDSLTPTEFVAAPSAPPVLERFTVDLVTRAVYNSVLL